DALYEQGFFTPQNSKAISQLLRKDNPGYYKARSKAKLFGQVKGFVKGVAVGSVFAAAAYFGVAGIDFAAEKMSDPNFGYSHLPNWTYQASACLALLSSTVMFTTSEGRKAESRFSLEKRVQ
ncbi:hypothetical protein HY837_04305, partial [archaeon]|nr:hypothetical protein [archaeon]